MKKHKKHKKAGSDKETGSEGTGKVSQDSEDISFNFSKIASLFKKNKTDAKKHADSADFDNDNKDYKEKTADEGSDDDIGFDMKGVSAFFKKNAIVFLIIFLVAVPFLVSINYRMYPAHLPITEQWAENSVSNMIRNNILSEVNKQYPNLPDATKNEIVNENYMQVLKTGTININDQQIKIEDFIKQQAEFFKEQYRNDENSHTYLVAIDPYHFYRHTRNYINHGFVQDIRNEKGEYCDMLILAGMPMEYRCSAKTSVELHVLVSAWTYRVMNFFDKETDLMKAMFYVPIIIASLCVIPAFFIGRRVSGNFAGFISAMLVAIHPAFISRTAGGFSDTDGYNILFPLFCFWFIIEAIYSDSLKKTIIFSALAGLFMGLFSFAWGGWYFIFNIIIAGLAVYLGYIIACNWRSILKIKLDFIKNMKIKIPIAAAALFFVFCGIFVTIFSGFSKFTNFIGYTKAATELKVVATTKIWPNVLTTVAELNPANVSTVLNNLGFGSKLLLFLGFLGIIMPIIRKGKNRNKNIIFLIAAAVWYMILISTYKSFNNEHLLFGMLIMLPVMALYLYYAYKGEIIRAIFPLIIGIWFVVIIYASDKGVRFIMLLIPAFALSVGYAAGTILNMLSEWIIKELKINRIVTYTILGALIFLLVFFVPVNTFKITKDQSLNMIPSMNDAWYNTLIKIKTESKPDAIINSWWDFGHWFAAIGERAVTLDGGRQNNPAAHWLGKLMLTWDEDESVGILRYLDCGSNHGFVVLDSYIKNELESIRILYEIIPVSEKQKAKNILISKGLSDNAADEVLMYTHCKPPENYFITSQDMVGKSGVWAHFGAWDFEKATMYNKLRNENESEALRVLMQEFGLNKTAAQKTFNDIKTQDPNYWIAPWPSYAGSQSGVGIANTTKIQCASGIVFDYQTKEAVVKTQQGDMHPAAVAFINQQGNFEIVEYDKNILIANNQRPLGTAIVPKGNNNYECILMDNALTGSIFTRLFYYENMDQGLVHFDMYHKVIDVAGQKIIVWKIDWEGRTKTDSAKTAQTDNIFI